MALIRCGAGAANELDIQVVQHAGYSPGTTVTSLNISIDSSKTYAWGWLQAGSDPAEASIYTIIDKGQVIWTGTLASSLNLTVNNGKLEGGNFAAGYGGAWTLYTLY